MVTFAKNGDVMALDLSLGSDALLWISGVVTFGILLWNRKKLSRFNPGMTPFEAMQYDLDTEWFKNNPK